MSNFTAALGRTGTLSSGAADECAAEVVRSLRDKLYRQTSFYPTKHKQSYYTKQLGGGRSMPLTTFIYFLFAVRAMGNLCGQNGQDWVRRVLQVIADRFDLDVIARRPRVGVQKPEPLEELDVHQAVGRLSCLLKQARSDGRFDHEEKLELQEAIFNLHQEADDLLAVVR